MFYTSLITSLLPYILLTGIFGTLLVNRIATSKRTEGGEINYAAFQKKQTVDDSRTFFYAPEKNKDKEKNHENISTSRLSNKDFDLLNNWEKCYPPCNIPLISNTDLNSTYSFRGPPS